MAPVPCPGGTCPGPSASPRWHWVALAELAVAQEEAWIRPPDPHHPLTPCPLGNDGSVWGCPTRATFPSVLWGRKGGKIPPGTKGGASAARFDILTPVKPCRRGAQEGVGLGEPCQGTWTDRHTDGQTRAQSPGSQPGCWQAPQRHSSLRLLIKASGWFLGTSPGLAAGWRASQKDSSPLPPCCGAAGGCCSNARGLGQALVCWQRVQGARPGPLIPLHEPAGAGGVPGGGPGAAERGAGSSPVTSLRT